MAKKRCLAEVFLLFLELYTLQKYFSGKLQKFHILIQFTYKRQSSPGARILDATKLNWTVSPLHWGRVSSL